LKLTVAWFAVGQVVVGPPVEGQEGVLGFEDAGTVTWLAVSLLVMASPWWWCGRAGRERR